MYTRDKARSPSPVNPARLAVKKLEFGVAEDPNLGLRQGMEDFTIAEPDLLADGALAFFCVLDGHGGPAVAKHLKQNYAKLLRSRLETYRMAYSVPSVLKMTIDNVENQLKMIGGRDNGSTFCGVLVDRVRGCFFTVNIGDSKALLVRSNGTGKLDSSFVTVDHKVTNPDEAERIKKAGGVIFNGRLAGNLLVTRSLGDFDLKKYGLVSTPDIAEHNAGFHDLLVIASDGLWDVLGPGEVEKGMREWGLENLPAFAKRLIELAVQKGSNDNISVIVVKLVT